ncbi:MAG TPA: hypothetical protein VG267_03965 [Terracidiphilus sp.]|nr:hypothetical protein [Terracidiphilus sp.]
MATSLGGILLCVSTSAPSAAQETGQGAEGPAGIATAVIPQQVRYNGKLAGRAGQTVDVVFRIYAVPEDGEPLWTETQRIPLSEDGSYSVLLGSADPKGLPQTVFAAGMARWLGVSVEQAPETDRVLLASVPYAMKSADAEALAGHAAADFVTQEQLSRLEAQRAQTLSPSTAISNTLGTVTGSGTTGTIPLWTGALTQGNSNMVQVGSNIGINEATPAAMLDVGGSEMLRGTLTMPSLGTATTSGGSYSQIMQFDASAWSSTTSAAVTPIFKLYAFPEGNNTANPSSTFFFQYQLGATTTNVLSVASNGLMTTNGGLAMRPQASATASAAVNSPQFILGASSYSSGTSAAVAQNFVWQVLATGNDTPTPSGNLALLYGSGTHTPTVTGFSILPTGIINWAAGQTFPGTGSGTITGITTSSPLTGSGTSGSVALGLNQSALETTFNSVYPQLATSNTFALGASFGGPISAAASGASATAVTATGTSGAFGLRASSDSGSAGRFTSASAPLSTIFSEDTASFDGSYIPVALNATTTGADSIGAYGSGTIAGLAGAASAGIGVWGISGSLNSLPTLSSTGVVGDAQLPGAGNAGALGFTSGTQSTSYAYEVSRGSVAGVWGDTTGNPASAYEPSVGVLGTTDAYDGYGGAFIANGAYTDAVFAKNLNSGYGLYAESLGVGVTSGRGTGGSGVEGFTPSPAKGQAGVLGNAYQLSATSTVVAALGPVGFVAGVWGDSGEVNDGTTTYTAGVVGTGDDITAALFENNSGHPTLVVTNLNTSGPTGLFSTMMATTADGTCGFGSAGSLTCTGQMKSLATTSDSRQVETYSMQSPENWMEDFGSGELKQGVAVVRIDPAFSETVTADASYHVFITPNADSRGLYVIAKTPTTFEVRESGGGTSSLTFDYRIVGKRRGFESQRLTDVTAHFNAERARALPPTGAGVPRRILPQMTSPGGPAVPGVRAQPRTAPRNRGPVHVGSGRTVAMVKK